MKLRRKQHFDFGSFGLPDHALADAFSRMWRTCESVRKEEPQHNELEQIADRFYLKGREAVSDFLDQHHALVPVLIQVRTKFDEYFGIIKFARPRLELFIDPEGESEPSLFALVPTTLSFQEAVARLDRLDNDWWLDQPDEIKALMNIDVEYVNGPTI